VFSDFVIGQYRIYFFFETCPELDFAGFGMTNLARAGVGFSN